MLSRKQVSESTRGNLRHASIFLWEHATRPPIGQALCVYAKTTKFNNGRALWHISLACTTLWRVLKRGVAYYVCTCVSTVHGAAKLLCFALHAHHGPLSNVRVWCPAHGPHAALSCYQLDMNSGAPGGFLS